jgi:alginate O-acetyltransferase complex protein AlgI
MRNYLYIPLGGNRVSDVRLYFNLWLVFLLSGLWHGAAWGFIVWGAWHGLWLVFERLFLLKLTERIGKIPRILLTMFIVTLGWVVFRVEHLKPAWTYIKSMFGFSAGTISQLPDLKWYIVFYIAMFFSFFVVVNRGQNLQNRIYGIPSLSLKGHVAMTACAMILFVLSLSYILGEGYNPFIYFRF